MPGQDTIRTSGHSIEYRIYAEDPKTFFPSPGTLAVLKWGAGARIETGYEEGNIVTPFYDPMIAKVILTGASREEVLEKSRKFFDGTAIEGVKTNLPLFDRFIESKPFIEGNYATAVLAQWLTQQKEEKTV